MIYYYYFLSLLLFQFSQFVFTENNSKYALALQHAVIKPKVCGVKYFQDLEKHFISHFDPQIAAEPIRISQYCQTFSSENDVTVNILDAQGIDMCSFRNQISALYAQFFTLLNERNAEDRYNYYITYLNTHVPLPSTDPNFDIYGLGFFYRQITSSFDLAYAALEAQIAIISGYKNSGNQGVAIIQLSSAIAAAVASFPPNQYVYQGFLFQINPSTHSDVTIISDPIVLTINFLRYYYMEAGVFVMHPQINVIISKLSQEKIIVLSYLGTFGIIKNQASPLYVNAIQDGICYWAENHFFGLTGIMYRLVFSQPKENLISK